MSKDKMNEAQEQEVKEESTAPEAEEIKEETAELVEEAAEVTIDPILAALNDKYLRICAEYDNFRKRSQKEKDSPYTNGKADTLSKLLPVYDNLERAMNQPTEDAAYKKGVEMTMQGLIKIFEGLGVEVYGETCDAFDPNLHNVVMHIESEELGENTIAQVFQKGFKTGEKVIRFAMVQVAN